MREEFTVMLSREYILTKLRDNYQRYKDSRGELLNAFKEASREYQKDWIIYTTKVMEGKLLPDDKKPTEPQIPRDYTKRYESWIEMIVNAKNDSLEVSYQDFMQLCRDEWAFIREHVSWLRTYASSTSTSTITAANLVDYADSYDEG